MFNVNAITVVVFLVAVFGVGGIMCYSDKCDNDEEKKYLSSKLTHVCKINERINLFFTGNKIYIFGQDAKEQFAIINKIFGKKKIKKMFMTNDKHDNTSDEIIENIKKDSKPKVLFIDEYALEDEYLYEWCKEVMKIGRAYNCIVVVKSCCCYDEIYYESNVKVISKILPNDGTEIEDGRVRFHINQVLDGTGNEGGDVAIVIGGKK